VEHHQHLTGLGGRRGRERGGAESADERQHEGVKYLAGREGILHPMEAVAALHLMAAEVDTQPPDIELRDEGSEDLHVGGEGGGTGTSVDAEREGVVTEASCEVAATETGGIGNVLQVELILGGEAENGDMDEGNQHQRAVRGGEGGKGEAPTIRQTGEGGTDRG
jgi:hypothetical protein